MAARTNARPLRHSLLRVKALAAIELVANGSVVIFTKVGVLLGFLVGLVFLLTTGSRHLLGYVTAP